MSNAEKTGGTASVLPAHQRIRQARPADEPRENDYIRLAVDGMRRSTEEGQRIGQTTEAGAASYKLACYRQAIKDLYAQRDDELKKPGQIINLMRNVVRTLHGGQDLKESFQGLPAEAVQQAMIRLGRELLRRLNEPQDYDPVETVALIEYRLRYADRFFEHIGHPEDRRISEAIRTYALMRQGLPLPEYPAQVLPLLNEAAGGLPPSSSPADALRELNRDIAELRTDERFRAWVEANRAQFRQKTPPIIQDPAKADPWQVKDSTALDHESTTYDPAHVNHTPEEIDRLRKASGRRPELLVVFKPERMALHETIAAAVTRMKMDDPIKDMQNIIIGKKGLFEQSIKPRIDTEKLNERFEKDRRMLSDYVDEVMDDHFHIVNPNMEIRNELDKAKQLIIRRIVEGGYDPRLVESRQALHHLVADELLRRRYVTIIRRIVDEEIDLYLKEHPELALPLKPDSERMAWVTVGGPASGKSTLQKLILTEYRHLHGADSPLCQVNSDHYKPLLLKKTGADPQHGARTYWESGMVRQRIIDRLEEMIEKDRKAPDFWVSTMVPSPERMKIAGHGGAKVNIYVVTCPVEGSLGAVQRAHKRALDETSEDYQRFMSTRDILHNHKYASSHLPTALQERRRDLRLYDNTRRPVTLVASMDSHNREMRVLDAGAFLDFLKKSFINEHAESEAQVYATLTDRQMAEEFCRYPEAGVSLNFRYGARTPNPVLPRIEAAALDRDHEEIRPLLPPSQPESYAWIGHGRAIIRDIDIFARACGPQRTEAILMELKRRWPLSVRDYEGKTLLEIDETGKTIYYHPQLVKTDALQASLQRVASTLPEESRHAGRKDIGRKEPTGAPSGTVRSRENAEVVAGKSDDESGIRTDRHPPQAGKAITDEGRSGQAYAGLSGALPEPVEPVGVRDLPPQNPAGARGAAAGEHPAVEETPGGGEWTKRIRATPQPPSPDDPGRGHEGGKGL